MKPLVSVFIPVYNREKYIADAINSILNQTFTDFELIIIDDGSTDNTREILASYNDKRIKLFFNEKNMGIPYTRNKGLECAKGEFIALLDSDDVAVPDRLEKQLNFFKTHPDCVIVGGFVGVIDQHIKLIKKIKYRYTDPDHVSSSLLFNCSIHNTTVMAKTNVLKKFNYNKHFTLAQDVDLLVRLNFSKYKLYNMNKILVFQREHKNRTTTDKLDFNKSIRKEILKNQLKALNISFTDIDLYNHLYLKGNYIKLDNFNIDDNYIRWAQDWLVKLINANNKLRIYPVKAFKSVVCHRWICIFSHIKKKNVNAEVLKCFLTSPLSMYAISHLPSNFLQYLRAFMKLQHIYSSTFI